jgi:hypothetical protein
MGLRGLRAGFAEARRALESDPLSAYVTADAADLRLEDHDGFSRILAMTPVRLDAPTLIMTALRKLLTVLVLMFICAAISLLVSPFMRNLTVSHSRLVS